MSFLKITKVKTGPIRCELDNLVVGEFFEYGEALYFVMAITYHSAPGDYESPTTPLNLNCWCFNDNKFVQFEAKKEVLYIPREQIEIKYSI